LQDVLSNLRESVDQLTSDNDQLAAKDQYMNQQILQLQMQLGVLMAQGDVLNKAAGRLKETSSWRAGQITRLEEENFDLDNHIQKDKGGIKFVRQSLDKSYEEDQKLLLQLKGKMPSLSMAEGQTPASLTAVHFQKEKLRLLKMIYDSQQRQEALHQSILEFQKNTPALPVVSALAHQQFLKKQIQDLEAQIATHPPEKFSGNSGYANQWDDGQVQQLESELRILEANYAQLKNLVNQMSKKVQNARTPVSQHVEEDKLQGSIDELNRQREGLMAQLDDLRSQMVDLDKRKSRLQTMIQQSQ
jgi:chromosome segregation ATPase